jgi:MFS transporter, DHA1 family, tetracycline resistance protein
MIFGAAGNGWWFSVGIIPLCLWGLAPAAAQAIMTRRVSAREQGELQGAVGSIRGLSAVFGPAIFTTAFAVGIAHGVPGLNWYVAAALLCFAALPVLREAPSLEEYVAPEAEGPRIPFPEELEETMI